MADSNIQSIDSVDEFNALITGNTYVIVDFWATWCPPCKAMAPIFAKLAAEHAVPGHLAFAKIDSDVVSEVTKEYSVTGLPTFLLFEDGRADGIDLASKPVGPMVKTTENGHVRAIQGADPKNLLAVAVELSRRAKEKKDSELSFGTEDF